MTLTTKIQIQGISPQAIGAVAIAEKGAADGVATLDENRKVLSHQLPPILTVEQVEQIVSAALGTALYVETITSLVHGIINAQKGVPNGLATLTEWGALTISQQPNGMLFFYNYNQPFGIPKLDENSLIEEQALPLSIRNRIAALEQEVQDLKA